MWQHVRLFNQSPDGEDSGKLPGSSEGQPGADAHGTMIGSVLSAARN